MAAPGYAQIIRHAVVLPIIVKRVLGVGPNDRRHLSSSHPASNYDRSRTLSLFVLQKDEVFGDRRYRSGPVNGTRARGPEHRRIQDRRGENMRFLHGERKEVPRLVAAEKR